MTKLFRKLFKRFFQAIGVIAIVLVLAGFVFRVFGPEAHEPLGEMVTVKGVDLHIYATGEKSNKPTVVIEGGASASTEYYHWLSEGLKDNFRVVRYDRAGNGYSELSDEPRSAENIVEELHLLLEKVGEEPPYILMGHSMGGPYIRVFAQQYPNEVAALFFLDATHPKQAERLNAAPRSSFKYKAMLSMLGAASFFADLGVVGLFKGGIDPLLADEGLPDEVNERINDYLIDGKRISAYKNETEHYHESIKRSGEAKNFGDIPIRVFTATAMDREAYQKSGIDPDEHLKKTIALQKEFTELSSDGKQFLIEGSHQTIFTKKENAAIIIKEVLELLK